jgi:tripartite-type tricarboxylate transporter receptor subunit TctC
MRISVRGGLAALALALGMTALAPGQARAQADSFPTRPVTLVVPWPAGGPTDRHLRVMAELAGKKLGQPIIVDNKPGAAGTLGGATMAATAKPDGYTIAQLPITIFRLPYMQKVSWDPKKDFTFIIHLTGYTLGVAVNTATPWKTWGSLIEYARANPGKLRYATAGAGSTPHITMEQIALYSGFKWVHVPFKGSAEVAAAILGEHVDVAADGTGLGPLIDADKLKMLVVWTEERSPRFPDAPTLLESGQKIVSASPYGIAGPKGIDPKIVQKLHDALKAGFEDPLHMRVLNDLSQPVIYKNSADYQAYAMQLIAEQQDLIQKLGLANK